MMTVTIKGYTTLTGKPETILRLMQEARLFDANIDAESYIETIQETALRCFGVPLIVTGNTYAERAESLLRAMAANGMIDLKD